MKPGLPKKYAKMGFKKGWKEFKKTKAYTGKSKSKSKSKSGGNQKVTKSGFNMNKIYGAIRKVAIFLPAVGIAIGTGTTHQKLVRGSRAYFGFDPVLRKFNWSWLMEGWGPAFGAQVVTRIPAVINKFLGMFR